MKQTEQKYTYRVLRAIHHEGQIVGAGQLVELPRSIGADLTTCGRVEPRDADQFADAMPAPAFQKSRGGIIRR